jgi:DNA-binding NarL/FixJ family response regulator
MAQQDAKPRRASEALSELARGGPRGLAVDLLDVDGEDFAVFQWSADEPALDALTAAEREVLDRIVAGDSNAAIARARATSVRTVANQVASLLRKLGAGSRYDLIRRVGAQAGARARDAGQRSKT